MYIDVVSHYIVRLIHYIFDSEYMLVISSLPSICISLYTNSRTYPH